MAEERDAELVFPTRRITVDYERPASFLRWRWTRRVRRTFAVRTRSARELLYIQVVYDATAAKLGHADLVTTCVVLIGAEAAYLPRQALEAIWDAHCELNAIPKDERPAAAEPSSGSSSGDSSAGPSTTGESGSST